MRVITVGCTLKKGLIKLGSNEVMEYWSNGVVEEKMEFIRRIQKNTHNIWKLLLSDNKCQTNYQIVEILEPMCKKLDPYKFQHSNIPVLQHACCWNKED